MLVEASKLCSAAHAPTARRSLALIWLLVGARWSRQRRAVELYFNGSPLAQFCSSALGQYPQASRTLEADKPEAAASPAQWAH